MAADIITANSTKLLSEKDGALIPANDYEKVLHNEEKVAASVRLSINKAMTAKEE